MVEGADDVIGDGEGLGDIAITVCGAGDEDRCFAVGTCGLQGGRRAEWCFGIGGWIAVMENEVIVDLKLFEKPEDTLGL